MSQSGNQILTPSAVATIVTIAEPARHAADHRKRVCDLRAAGADWFVISSSFLSLSA
jgi:phosphoserine phosphatase